MNGHRRGERGQVAVYAILLFPVLTLVLALVLAVGSVESLRTRIGAQVDMAALTATQALDLSALSRGEQPRLIEPRPRRWRGSTSPGTSPRPATSWPPRLPRSRRVPRSW